MPMPTKLMYPAIALAIAALTTLSYEAGFFAGLENFFEDLLFTPKPVKSELVILAIDNQSIQSIGQWPWPREIFARALTRLEAAHPAVLGFDVMLSEPSRQGAADDATLRQTLGRITYPVVFPIEAPVLDVQVTGPSLAENLIQPLPEFLGEARVGTGHINVVRDADGITRKFPREIIFQSPTEKKVFPSFSEAALRRGKLNIPAASTLGSLPRIVYAAPAGSLRRIPVSRLLDEDLSQELRGKIVFLGATAPDLHDDELTPLGRGSSMPGVEVNAEIANMLLAGYRLSPLAARYMLLWILLASCIPALIFFGIPRSLTSLLVSVLVGIGHLAAVVLFFEHGLAANLIHINLAWMLSTGSLFSWRYIVGERERRELTKVFSKYVSKEVLAEILRDPRRVALGGEEREITVFFSDIRGFTTISEATTPRELVRILNEYFSIMSREIMAHGGVIDKYIGDAIMAFWGAPLMDPLQATHALEASLAMIRELEIFNTRLRERGDPEIHIGIGLYTGPAVVGNVGSEERLNYTAMGDTVNVSSRLEGLNKEYRTQIIIGETTQQQVGGAYQFTFLGSAQVKGRTEPLNIYTPQGIPGLPEHVSQAHNTMAGKADKLKSD